MNRELTGDSLELSVLFDISKILLHNRYSDDLWQDVLGVFQEKLGITRAALTLQRKGEVVIQASYGLNESEKALGRYRIGEGVTGKVFQTGQPAIILNSAEDDQFLNKTRARSRKAAATFICVPVINNNQIIGTFSADYPLSDEATAQKLLNLMVVIANILADAVETMRNEVFEKDRLQDENARLRHQLVQETRSAGLIGNSSAMRAIRLQMAQVSHSSATVLIRGESGTGKELIAQFIHYNSTRKDGPFVAVNCAALPESLIESELFGHEKGAFTGAHKLRRGRFEMANGGTLFLDEIGDISPSVQVKLLRVLQERVFERVGSQEPIKTDVRIIAATSRNLEDKMQDGSFREDLFYRLNVFPIHTPPLRSRKSDIISLADHFLDKYNRAHGKSVRRISTSAINMLMEYHWPGNIRELENMIERAVLVSTGGVINSVDLPASLQTAEASNTQNMLTNPGRASLETLASSFEAELISDSLKRNEGNVAAASRELQITIRKLHYKIDKLGIDPATFK